MPKQKYDYSALKLEFIKSDFDEIKSFITHKGLKYNAERGRRTKGWAKEKIEYKNRIMEKALLKNAEKTANSLELPMEQLTIAKKNAVIKVIQKMMGNDLDMADMERAIKILRTEMGLPTTYSKNENMNLEKIEGIHIVMGGNPNKENKLDDGDKI